MDTKFTTPSEDSPSSIELDFLSASRLAASGRLDEAKAMLSSNGVFPATPQALDLLARIAVQTGDFGQARKLWQAALQKNPTFEPAQKALASLNTPWFAIAAIKRIAFLAFVTAMGCLAFVGLLALCQVVPSSTLGRLVISASRQPKITKQVTASAEPKPSYHTPSLAANSSKEDFAQIKELQEQQAHQIGEQIQQLQSSQTDILTSQKRIEDHVADLHSLIQAQSTQQKESQQLMQQAQPDIHNLTDADAKAQPKSVSPIASPQNLPQLDLVFGGIRVQSQDSVSCIYFENGLFARDDYFKIGSKAFLESVARALVRTQEKINIEVVGFAVNEPPTWPWQKPKSNAMLGQLRAERVKYFLENLKLFPAGAIVATNGPLTDLPYTAENIRNRTVVLRISQH